MSETLFPKYIQIQTHSYCNKSCSYCPYETVKDRVPMGFMDFDLKVSLIDEFVEKGGEMIMPYLMSEPLLDERLFELLDYIRSRSRIPVEINTNCLLLDKERGRKLAEYPNILFHLHLNDYNSTAGENARKFLELNPRGKIGSVELYADYIPDAVIRKWCGFCLELVDIKRPSKRAGNVYIPHAFQSRSKLLDKAYHFLLLLNRHPTKSKQNDCRSCAMLRDLEWFHILWDGTVVLCCQDWMREVILGNVKDNSIEEIFNNEQYRKIRQYISNSVNAPTNFLCRKCDYWVKGKSTGLKKWRELYEDPSWKRRLRRRLECLSYKIER